jgi:hypothetical protein
MKAVGLMQRPERVLCLGGGVAMSPILELAVAPASTRPVYWLAVAALALVAVLTNVTAAGRTRFLVGSLRRGGPPARLRGLGGLMVTTAADLSVFVALSTLTTLGVQAAVGLAALWGGALHLAFSSDRGRPSLVVIGGNAVLGALGTILLLGLIGPTPAWLLARAVVLAGWTVPLLHGALRGPRARPLRRAASTRRWPASRCRCEVLTTAATSPWARAAWAGASRTAPAGGRR